MNKTREKAFIVMMKRIFAADLKAVKRSFNTISNTYPHCYSIESGLSQLIDEDLP